MEVKTAKENKKHNNYHLGLIVKELDGARITKLEIIKEETSEEKVEENN